MRFMPRALKRWSWRRWNVKTSAEHHAILWTCTVILWIARKPFLLQIAMISSTSFPMYPISAFAVMTGQEPRFFLWTNKGQVSLWHAVDELGHAKINVHQGWSLLNLSPGCIVWCKLNRLYSAVSCQRFDSQSAFQSTLLDNASLPILPILQTFDFKE